MTKHNSDTVQIIESIAADMGVRKRTLQKWRERRSVPHRHRLPIAERALERGLRIEASVFDNFERPADQPLKEAS